MREVLISIRPEWVEKILNGEKTIEIRKTMPKCELPCKVYIYCTNAKPYLYRLNDDNEFELTNKLRFQEDCFVKDYNAPNRKVVAEFTLNKVDTIEICDPYVFRNNEQEDWWYFKENACLDCEEMMAYIGYGSDHDGWGNEYSKGFAWHIDNLKIYDKPKELCEFTHNVPDYSNGVVMYSLKKEALKRPPQSWCYVEKVEE